MFGRAELTAKPTCRSVWPRLRKSQRLFQLVAFPSKSAYSVYFHDLKLRPGANAIRCNAISCHGATLPPQLKPRRAGYP
jgi:hypothetical protein